MSALTSPTFIFVLILMGIISTLIFMGIQNVPQGMEYTIERFGKYTRSLTPGFNYIIPLWETISNKVSMRERVMDIPSQDIITRDNAMVKVDGIVFYRIFEASKATYEVENVTGAIEDLTTTNIRSVMGSMDLDELLSRRDEINTRLLEVVDKATDPWGIQVLRVEIKDIRPPQDLVDSMTRQMKAERDRRASILEAEGMREAEVLNARGKKEAIVLEATGQKEAAFLEAESREREAEAEAKATMMMSEAISKGSIHAVNFFVAQEYIKALSELASADNQKVILMPLEASSVIGSVGGIGELMKEAMTQQKAAPPPPTTPTPTAIDPAE